MSDSLDFYKAFEDKHRGSRELIKTRLGVYKPFVTPLLDVFHDAPAVDLGCGRGEWLEVLRDIGFSGIGVDLDEEMLNAAKLNNLEVELADAVEYLKHQPDDFFSIVSAFHVAEHLPFDALQALVQESLRVLKPGGLLILETPNPENVTVGANSFYLDPTHERPLPQELLSFLPEYYGFARTGVLRLQESKEIGSNESGLKLIDVFTGVSPDYAVVAQKAGNEQASSLLESVFNQNFGISLESLANRYERQWLSAHSQAVDKLQAISDQAVEAAKRAAERADQAAVNAARSHAIIEEMEEELRAVYLSRSWRYTKAARWLSFQWLLLRKLGPVARIKSAFRKVIVSSLSLLAVWIGANPKLRRRCVLVAQKLGIYGRLRRIYHGGSILNHAGSSQWRQHAAESLGDLTPEAREVHRKLYGALKKRRGSE